MDRATTIDAKLQAREQEKKAYGRSKPAVTEIKKATSSGGSGNSTVSLGHRYGKGYKVYMMGLDGRAKKGEIEQIGENKWGQVIPTVKWNDSTKAQVPFQSIKVDT